MNAFEMDNTVERLGNPVEAWWNETRQHVDSHIALLRNIPPNLNVELSFQEIDRAYKHVIDAEYPEKAAEVRAYLLASVENLRKTLVAIIEGDRDTIIDAYTEAYNRYIDVCRLLLERGIFEPVPRSRKSRLH